MTIRQMPWRLRLGLLALAPLLLLSVLFAFLPPDGLEGSSSAQFIGRFHPLTVHFPIALILIVPLLEWAEEIAASPICAPQSIFSWRWQC